MNPTPRTPVAFPCHRSVVQLRESAILLILPFVFLLYAQHADAPARNVALHASGTHPLGTLLAKACFP
ncbi:hypothetical protein M407DRAFT_242063 [Tulasnella calospora MUT 4182]|uniref:Uncharacterized protein n=1 Tax=Tulasnella calospora MUT 4182 TaxID=1051891 RepID=A0A0C3QQN5_9AGAM|nr:hypothetical protein M407DRAFT_242063 [Tulasnella calospora MUT 4182]